MNKTLRTISSNNRIFSFMMILGLFTLFLSGCGQPTEPAKNTTVTVSNTTASGAASNTTPNTSANTTANTAASNTNSTSTASDSTTTAAAAPGTCGETPGDGEVYIYEHIFNQDKGGKCVKLTAGEYKDAAATGLADNIMSSIRVGKNVHAVLCDLPNFGGACMSFDADDDNFTNNATIKNDMVSSVKVVKAEICSPSTNGEKVSIAWTNKTDKTLRINWIDTKCKEENNTREIKPGDVYNGTSYVGHNFHITNFQTGEKYGYIHVNQTNAKDDIKDIK